MDGTDVSGFSTPDTNVPVQQSIQVSAPGTASSPVADISVSSIQKSEMEVAALLMASQFPGLIPPSGVSGVDSAHAAILISISVDKMKNDIITSMWDNFQKSVDELAERAKKDDIKHWMEKVSQNGPKSATEYQAYILALSATARADEITPPDSAASQSALSVQFSNAFNQWIAIPSSDPSMAVNGPGKYPDPSFIAGTVASNSDAIRDSIGAVGLATGVQMSVSPVADALAAVGPASGLPADYQAAAALVAALLNGGAVYKATADAIEESARSGKPPQDLEFALNYAQNILAIVSHNVEKETPADPHQSGRNQMIRLMLSVMALNLVYRAAYGGMEGGKEFADLLEEGGTNDLNPAIKPTIQKLVAQIQSFLPTDPAERANVIASLSEYIDSKDSVDSMLSTTRMFAASLGEKPDLLQKRLEVNNS